MDPGKLGKWIDTAVHYATKDMRLAILAAALLIGLAVWGIDTLASLFERRVALDEGQRARLALAAPYFTMHGFREGDLAGVRPLGRARIRWLLKKDWGITDQASAIDRLNGLLTEGHRSDPSLRDPNQPAADLAIVDRALLAWDGIRVVFLARCCYAVGHIDEATVWAAIAAAIQLIRGRFRGWEEWGRSFVAGRVIWAGGGGGEYEPVVEKLLRDSGSVWNRVPWELATRP